ncbi:class I SAM-dependent methyltransferase [Paenibacillus rhizophilus]|uniref:Methyltransferase domain-containing protein n=1 Tax=Paenibacillus rhizophilus TaxID=1850366 RepID=A0A3N9PY57_9BACL|nr:class I SAM-dependent methyltransferase [Paenibacillus rhizophilus]RQW10126.1 methyltransferase domain-containing protein [Paenibacillus rhizophilus]
MIDVLFDQYQRYQNVTDIINSMRMSGQVFNILEVGANEHQNLEKFLPVDQITYLDIQLPEYLQNNPKYIIGDATSMDFSDNQYNIVVALDVFEHIFEKDREKFLNELNRVSSDFFVITAPFHSPEVVEAERRVNAVYKSIFGKDFIWLEEHMMNGLPVLTKMSEYLKAQNIQFEIINHGDVRIWERLMAIHFIAAQDSRLGVYRNEIDRFYNQHLFGNDFVEESYRKICVGSKNRNLSALPLRKINLSKKEENLLKLDSMEKIFYSLANLPLKINKDDASGDFIQIFKDEGAGFTEDKSIKFNLKSIRQHIHADLESQKLKSIRIDPSNFKGSFEIKNIIVTINNQNNLPKAAYTISGNFNLKFNNTFIFLEDDPYVILNFLMEEAIKEVSFDIVKLSQDDASISIADYFTEHMGIIGEKMRLMGISHAKSIEELKQQISELSAKNSELMKTNQSLIMEVENHKFSNDTCRETINEISQKNTQLTQTNGELHQTILELQQVNNSNAAELKAIYESRGWIYLTKIKNLIGK